MGCGPYGRGSCKFLKHVLARDFRLFGVAAIQGIGPFGMLDLGSAMEEVAEEDDAFLARRDQQRCVTCGMSWSSENPHCGCDNLSLLSKPDAILQQIMSAGSSPARLRLERS